MATFSRHRLSQVSASGTPQIAIGIAPWNSGQITRDRPGYLIHEVPVGVQDEIFLYLVPGPNIGGSTNNATVFASGQGQENPVVSAGGWVDYLEFYQLTEPLDPYAIVPGNLTLEGGSALYVHGALAIGSVIDFHVYGHVNRITP